MTLPETRKDELAAAAPVKREAGIAGQLAMVGQGAGAALLGSVCCLLPVVVFAVGLTGGFASAAVGLSGALQPYSLVLGLGFVGIASWVTLQRSQACCTPEEYRRRWVIVPMTMLASFAIVYVAVMYLLIPLLM